MNTYLLISCGIAAMATLGHFTGGQKIFVGPVLRAPLDEITKRGMRGVWNFVGVDAALSAVALGLVGTGKLGAVAAQNALVWLIIAKFAAYAAIFLGLALTSHVKNAVFKLFPWIFFVLIAAFAYLGLRES